MMRIGIYQGRAEGGTPVISYGNNIVGTAATGMVRTGIHVPRPEIIPDARQRAALFDATYGGRKRVSC